MDNLKTILTQLKLLGCSGIKISFEDEGALFNEIITMRNLTTSVGIELSVKIGGCEAKSDIINCIDLCCDTIVAPMIESEFALKKFLNSLNSCNYKNKKSFNLETMQGYKNVDEISNTFSLCNSITFGRVDFVSSFGKDRSFVDSELVFDLVREVFEKSKKQGLLCNIGGAISIDSKEFITKLINEGLLDYFETRYIIFDCSKINMSNYDELLYNANLFELEWLKFIHNKYLRYANKDVKRIEMIQERIDKNKIH
jgi:hypothetical protein